jgi:serine/threonine-protein kinase RsbW
LDVGCGGGSPRTGGRVEPVFLQTRPAVPESVAPLRAAVADFAAQAGVPQSTIDTVKLAVSEAATNVVVHAYQDAPAPGLIHVEADVAAHELRVTVADDGSGLRPEQQSPGLGLGLGLIARLADNFELLQGGNGGLRVRMRFAIPPAPADS